MRNNERLPWMIGIGVLAVTLVGWLTPRRRGTADRMMGLGRNTMNMMGDLMRGPMSKTVMKSGRRMIKGMLR
jgi:hypothetical protein